MPIEIRELIIKATVAEDPGAGSSTPTPSTNNAVQPSEEVIHACVEKILSLLRDKMER
jgi:hypothetical protein